MLFTYYYNKSSITCCKIIYSHIKQVQIMQQSSWINDEVLRYVGDNIQIHTLNEIERDIFYLGSIYN